MNSTIGFIGLGNMGSGMAKNLAVSGYTVIGFDIVSKKQDMLSISGFTSADSIAYIAKKCEIVILCLPR